MAARSEMLLLTWDSVPMVAGCYQPVSTSDGEVGLVNIWEVASQRPFGKSISQGSPYAVAAISHDGRHVVTACDDGNARLWDVDNSFPGSRYKHRTAVRFVGFGADGQRIVTASRDKTARVWKTSNHRTSDASTQA